MQNKRQNLHFISLIFIQIKIELGKKYFLLVFLIAFVSMKLLVLLYMRSFWNISSHFENLKKCFIQVVSVIVMLRNWENIEWKDILNYFCCFWAFQSITKIILCIIFPVPVCIWWCQIKQSVYEKFFFGCYFLYLSL